MCPWSPSGALSCSGSRWAERRTDRGSRALAEVCLKSITTALSMCNAMWVGIRVLVAAPKTGRAYEACACRDLLSVWMQFSTR